MQQVGSGRFFHVTSHIDLTVDHAFFDSCMHPWALRNVLDSFSGALTGAGITRHHAARQRHVRDTR